MVIGDCFRRFSAALRPLYDEREATLITGMVLEKLTGYRRLDVLSRPEAEMGVSEEAAIETALNALLTRKPVQYVLGEAWFAGIPFKVSEAVLIPRPETEELVQWIREDLEHKGAARTILDLGTGSGCIAIALKQALPAARVVGVDVSAAALEVARENGLRHQAAVEWCRADILSPLTAGLLPRASILVTNPPYIPLSDRADMQPQVADYEPAEALFVPDDDPLVFYKATLMLAGYCLEAGGRIYAEVHEDFAGEVRSLFERGGTRDVRLRYDLQKRPRMLRATLG